MTSSALPGLPDAIAAWYQENARDLPWRRPDFHARYGAWGTLVAETMLQQTPVARVLAPLAEWLERWPTPAAQAAASPAETVTAWANLGYPRRALWLRDAAAQIVARHGGVVPRTVPELLALPGVGDYTARAVAVFAYGDDHPVVDTNIRRVLARAVAGQAHPGPPARRDLAEMAEFLAGATAASPLVNAATMELGAIVCTARAPRCEDCPLRAQCAWRAAGYPDTGDTRRRQARYEGSDRQARGAVLRALREGPAAGLAADTVASELPDVAQRARAIESLLADGLVEVTAGRLHLPR